MSWESWEPAVVSMTLIYVVDRLVGLSLTRASKGKRRVRTGSEYLIRSVAGWLR